MIAAAEKRLASDARRAQELAALAAEAVERLDPGLYGRILIADLAAHAWSTVGEALRRRGHHATAEAALTVAAARLAAGSAEPLEEARLLERAAALAADRGRPRAASALLRRVAALRASVGEGGEGGEAGEAGEAGGPRGPGAPRRPAGRAWRAARVAAPGRA